MERIGPFETQRRSDWFQNLLVQAENNLGHNDQSWTTRAMMAFETAGMEGLSLTVKEIEERIAPYIGWPENRHSLTNMARRAVRRGIIRRTGRKRYVEGTRNPYPEYEIVGHIEIDPAGDLLPVRVRG